MAEAPTQLKQHHARVASHTTGRLRIRVHKDLRPELMGKVHQHLEGKQGVHAVESNHDSGSVVIKYDPKHHTLDSLLDLIEDVGVLVSGIGEGGGEKKFETLDPTEPAGHSTTAQGIVGALDDLDRKLSAATGRKVDLKMLFPLGLAALAVRQLMRQGWGFSEVPAWVMLWYAFDAFHKLHTKPHPQLESVDGTVAA